MLVEKGGGGGAKGKDRALYKKKRPKKSFLAPLQNPHILCSRKKNLYISPEKKRYTTFKRNKKCVILPFPFYSPSSILLPLNEICTFYPFLDTRARMRRLFKFYFSLHTALENFSHQICECVNYIFFRKGRKRTKKKVNKKPFSLAHFNHVQQLLSRKNTFSYRSLNAWARKWGKMRNKSTTKRRIDKLKKNPRIKIDFPIPHS